jgi:hypothetical protein
MTRVKSVTYLSNDLRLKSLVCSGILSITVTSLCQAIDELSANTAAYSQREYSRCAGILFDEINNLPRI